MQSRLSILCVSNIFWTFASKYNITPVQEGGMGGNEVSEETNLVIAWQPYLSVIGVHGQLLQLLAGVLDKVLEDEVLLHLGGGGGVVLAGHQLLLRQQHTLLQLLEPETILKIY